MNVHLTPTSTHGLEWASLTLAERDQLRDAAMAQAHQLRREAISEFLRDAGALASDAIGHGRRAADRLVARLRQHAKQRAAVASEV